MTDDALALGIHHAGVGLWSNAPNSIADPHSKKRIWELFRAAGTPEWEAAAAPLLPLPD